MGVLVSAGDSISIDVATVHRGNQFLRYNVSMLAYGYFGECIVASEQNRWMGPRRYDWAGGYDWGQCVRVIVDGIQTGTYLHHEVFLLERFPRLRRARSH